MLEVEDYNGWQYKMDPLDIGLPLDSERMILIQISFNNKVFVFYHRDLDKMLVYGINLHKKATVEIDNALVQSVTAQKRKERPLFEFEYIFEIDFQKSILFDHLVNHGTDPVFYFVLKGS